MPAFNAPGILFIGAWGAADRKFLIGLMRKLKAHGDYTKVIEPCAGAFAMSRVYSGLGWKPEQIEASDIGLFSAALGCVFSEKPVAGLGVTIDGEPLPLTGNPIDDAAGVLFAQALLRMEAKPDVHHWQEHLKALEFGREQHIAGIKKTIEQMDEQLHGMNYRPMDLVKHIEEHVDDPNALIFIAPPTYRAGYERFFDTKGRLEWNEPEYGLWDPETSHRALAKASEGFEATLVSLQMTAETGGCLHNEPIYARHERKGITTYIWTNKPGRVLRWMEKEAVPRPGSNHEPLTGVKMLPHDYELTEKSRVVVERIEQKNARYYKDLWLHRIFPKDASWDFGVFIDGYLAGIGGYDAAMMDYRGGGDKWDDALILFYSVGVPGRSERITRLVMQLALLRETIDHIVPPWQAVRTNQLVTINMTKYPEAKQNRGILKLVDRKTDPVHGFKLTYAAGISDKKTEEVYREWHRKEQKRLSIA